jgi:hypothetical protein
MGRYSCTALRLCPRAVHQQLSSSVGPPTRLLGPRRKWATDSVRYTHQTALLTHFFRWFQEQPSWSLPLLYVLLSDLRDLAEQVGQAYLHVTIARS